MIDLDLMGQAIGIPSGLVTLMAYVEDKINNAKENGSRAALETIVIDIANEDLFSKTDPYIQAKISSYLAMHSQQFKPSSLVQLISIKERDQYINQFFQNDNQLIHKYEKEISAIFRLYFDKLNQYMNSLLTYGERQIIEVQKSSTEKLSGELHQSSQEIKDFIVAQKISFHIGHFLTTKPIPIDKDKIINFRVKEIHKIKNSLVSGTKVISLYGLGGIGKTAIARYLFYDLEEKFSYAAWIEYNGSLQENLIGQLNLFMDIEQQSDDRYRKIADFITNQAADLLLFVDNIDKRISNDPSLRLLISSNATVVLTSRIKNSEHFKIIPIDFLEREECIELFYFYFIHDPEKKQSDTVSKLVDLVSRHTLSVELLARIASECLEYHDLSRFLTDLTNKGFGFPDLEVATDHSHEMEATLAQHISKLYELIKVSPEQQRILKNFALYPSITVPLQIKDWLGCKTRDLQVLINFGWIQASQDGEIGYIMPDIIKISIQQQGEISYLDCQVIITYFNNIKQEFPRL